MNTVAFDTLQFSRALRDEAKFSAEQAEGIADALGEAPQGDIATKSDLRELGFRLEAKFEASKFEILKWMFGAIGFQTVIIVSAVIALVRLGH